MENPLSPQNSSKLKLPLDPIDALIVLGNLLKDHDMQDDVVLIGGQALYLWSLRYPVALPDFEIAMLTSRDLDYVRRIGQSIDLLVGAWNAKGYRAAGADDPHTPHEALVYFIDIDDKDVVVDLMAEVLGISSRDEVIENADSITVQGTPIWIMNPIHCLYSRIANAFGRGLGEQQYRREVIRIRAAVAICQGWLSEALDEGASVGDVTKAVNAVNYLVGYCRAKEARKVAKRTGINVACAIPLEHPVWSSTEKLAIFRSKTLLPAHNKLNTLLAPSE